MPHVLQQLFHLDQRLAAVHRANVDVLVRDADFVELVAEGESSEVERFLETLGRQVKVPVFLDRSEKDVARLAEALARAKSLLG